MEKVWFSILLICICNFSNAQIEKKSILLGGQFSYYNEKSQSNNLDQKFESSIIGISIGKAFKKNSVIGIYFTFSPNNQENILTGQDTATIVHNLYNIGAFYRNYKNIGNEFYFFSQVDAGYITGNGRNDYSYTINDVTSKTRGGLTSLTIGISYNVFKKMQLELTLPNLIYMQYVVTKLDTDNPQLPESKKEKFSVTSNLTNSSILGNVGIGFRFIL